MIPTYDEAENIADLAAALLALPQNLHVLVVDDDSPDGTWRIAAELASREPRVKLLHRKSDRGRGTAGRAGFLAALADGADAVVEMDADFSHDPAHVPALLAGLASADVVLGSRAVPGGADLGRPWWRRLVTRFANAYIRLVLQVSVRDCNSGFRAFTRQALERAGVNELQARGPDIVQELLFRCHRAGLRIAELPIRFVERSRGTSTLTFRTLLRGYWAVLHLRWRAWTGRLPRRMPRASEPGGKHARQGR